MIQLQPMHLATIRHFGPYEDVPESLFDRLAHWAQVNEVTGPTIWMGLGYDMPSLAPPDSLRFDACLKVQNAFQSQGEIVHRVFPEATLPSPLMLVRTQP